MNASWLLLLKIGIAAVTIEQFIHLSSIHFVSKKTRPPLIAIADADYLVARRQCADQAAHVRNGCVRAARAIQIAAKADANALEDTSVMTRAANDRVDAARKALREAGERMEVRNDTVTEKGNRDFQIAEEKCEMLVDDAQTECFKQSKKRLRRL